MQRFEGRQVVRSCPFQRQHGGRSWAWDLHRFAILPLSPRFTCDSSSSPAAMATESSAYRRVEEESRQITSGKRSPTPQERAPPRPSDMPPRPSDMPGTPSKGAHGQGSQRRRRGAPVAAASVSARSRPRLPPSGRPATLPLAGSRSLQTEHSTQPSTSKLLTVDHLPPPLPACSRHQPRRRRRRRARRRAHPH